MKCLRIIAIFALCMFLVSVAYAHPGGTDGWGGHYVDGTNKYHYHHGQSAHDHWDMDGDGDLDCPYDTDGTDRHWQSATPIKDELIDYFLPIAICLSLPCLIWAWDKLKDKFGW